MALSVQPPNDNFAGRIVIPFTSPLSPFAFSDDTTDASLEPNETVPFCGQNIAKSVWFDFVPTVTANYTLSTANSNFDTILGIYTGSAVNNLTRVICNDDA